MLKKFFLGIVIATVLIGGSVLYYEVPLGNPQSYNGDKSKEAGNKQTAPDLTDLDGQRVRAIRTIQYSLEIYRDLEKKGYPALLTSCQDISAIYNLVPKYITEFYADPTLKTGHENYKISVSEDRLHFVVRAILDNSKHPFLNEKNESDGLILNCDCNDPAYCLHEF